MSNSLNSYSDKIIAHSTPKQTESIQSKSLSKHSIQTKIEIIKKSSFLITKFDFKTRPQRSESEASDMKQDNSNTRETNKRRKSPTKGVNKKFKVNNLCY